MEKGQVYEINPRDIVVKEGFNSRVDFGDIEALAKSLELNGMYDPIGVFPITIDGETKYRLIDGERRYRATMYNLERGIENKVIAMLEDEHIDDVEQLIQQIVKNDTKNFNEMERALHYKKLLDMGLTKEEISERIDGNAKSTRINYCMQHLNRDPRIQQAILEGKIEGVLVRHVYSAHGKDDKEGAINEILTSIGLAEAKAEEEGNTTPIHITKKDLITNSVRVNMDSKAIKKGLTLLAIYNDALNPNKYPIGKLTDIAAALGKDGVTIEDIIKSAVAKAEKRA